MKAVKAGLVAMTHEEAKAAIESGSAEVAGETIDFKSEVISMYKYANEDPVWEGAVHNDGDVVISIDSTMDEALIASGKSRELMTNIQKLRKTAGLVVSDKIEAFYEEVGSSYGGTMSKYVKMNLKAFEDKFGGMIPLPKEYASASSNVLATATVDMDGVKLIVDIRTPALSVSPSVSDLASKFIATLSLNEVTDGQEISGKIDEEEFKLVEGKDFFKSATAMAKSENKL